jgi:hypothetical protein
MLLPKRSNPDAAGVDQFGGVHVTGKPFGYNYSHTVVVNSRMRSYVSHANADSFTVQLTRPIHGIISMELLAAKIPFANTETDNNVVLNVRTPGVTFHNTINACLAPDVQNLGGTDSLSLSSTNMYTDAFAVLPLINNASANSQPMLWWERNNVRWLRHAQNGGGRLAKLQIDITTSNSAVVAANSSTFSAFAVPGTLSTLTGIDDEAKFSDPSRNVLLLFEVVATDSGYP